MPQRTVSPEQLERRRAQRRQARTSQTYRSFLGEVEREASLSKEGAERATSAILCLLEERLMPEEAADLEAQLPARLRSLLHRCERHEALAPRKLGKPHMVQVLSEDLSLPPEDVEPLMKSVFRVLSRHVSAGEIDDVVHQLPGDLRQLWPPEVLTRFIQQQEKQAQGVQRRSVPPKPPPTPPVHEEAGALIDQLLAMPIDAQLGVLRTIAPRVLAHLGEGDRLGFVRELNLEIDRARHGEATYDLRPPTSA